MSFYTRWGWSDGYSQNDLNDVAGDAIANWIANEYDLNMTRRSILLNDHDMTIDVMRILSTMESDFNYDEQKHVVEHWIDEQKIVIVKINWNQNDDTKVKHIYKWLRFSQKQYVCRQNLIPGQDIRRQHFYNDYFTNITGTGHIHHMNGDIHLANSLVVSITMVR